MNKRDFNKERKINNRSFDFLSKQNIIVPLILDINDFKDSLSVVFRRLLATVRAGHKTYIRSR